MDAGFVLLMLSIAVTGWIVSKPFRAIAVSLSSK